MIDEFFLHCVFRRVFLELNQPPNMWLRKLMIDKIKEYLWVELVEPEWDWSDGEFKLRTLESLTGNLPPASQERYQIIEKYHPGFLSKLTERAKYNCLLEFYLNKTNSTCEYLSFKDLNKHAPYYKTIKTSTSSTTRNKIQFTRKRECDLISHIVVPDPNKELESVRIEGDDKIFAWFTWNDGKWTTKAFRPPFAPLPIVYALCQVTSIRVTPENKDFTVEYWSHFLSRESRRRVFYTGTDLWLKMPDNKKLLLKYGSFYWDCANTFFL